MCALLNSEPLAVVHSLAKAGRVQTYLHEHIFPRKRASAQLLDVLGRLELFLAKQQAQAEAQPQPPQPQSVPRTPYGRPPAATPTVAAAQQALLHPDAESLLAGGLDAVVASLADGAPTAAAYITSHNLAPLFPLSASALRIPFHEDKAAGTFNSHLRHMAALNELVAMAIQLQNDINLTNHKYMAHQLALLYQCLNQVGGEFLTFKGRVEERFEEIKGITAAGNPEPQLSADQKDWLMQLTTDIVSDAVFSGRPEVFSAGSPGLAQYVAAA